VVGYCGLRQTIDGTEETTLYSGKRIQFLIVVDSGRKVDRKWSIREWFIYRVYRRWSCAQGVLVLNLKLQWLIHVHVRIRCGNVVFLIMII
jgi:hypothetical protein